jgi:predicted DNA-binding protein (MmcQ/YjbR family)
MTTADPSPKRHDVCGPRCYSRAVTSYIDWVRSFCLSLPHTTEDVQWEHDLLFRIAGKIYCVANLEPGLSPAKLAFKCTPETFAELVEVEGIIPAPYMARNHWVAITDLNALRQDEIKDFVRGSYFLVRERLPKKTQAELAGSRVAAKRSAPSTPGRVARRKK